jgi:uncharacterized protein YoxC
MEGVGQRMNGHEQQMNGLLQGQKRLEQDVKGLKQGQKRLAQDVTTIKEIVINIENEQIPRINGLFDAFQVNQTANTVAVQRISSLEKGFDKLNFEVMALKAGE